MADVEGKGDILSKEFQCVEGGSVEQMYWEIPAETLATVEGVSADALGACIDSKDPIGGSHGS